MNSACAMCEPDRFDGALDKVPTLKWCPIHQSVLERSERRRRRQQRSLGAIAFLSLLRPKGGRP